MTKAKSVLVIDYGTANIGSVANMLRFIGADAVVTDEPNNSLKFSSIILPGVGSFKAGCTLLNQHHWYPFLQHHVMDLKTPILGICLGIQLLCKHSTVSAGYRGLDFVNDNFSLFSFSDPNSLSQQDSKIKLPVPHMGWNTISFPRDSIFEDKSSQSKFYFVHSFHSNENDSSAAYGFTEYGYKFPSFFQKENIIGIQAHPEKSHKHGIRFLKKFLSIN